MRTGSPPLLPLFRSEGQGRLLARVYLDDRSAPLAQIARELGLDPGGLTREADRLEEAGLVRSERVGRQRILRPNTESPYYGNLQGLLMTAFGPAAVAGPALAALDGVEEAFIYGSWAARYRGQPGDQPADVDVLIVGSPSRREVARVTRRLTESIGREVNATIVTPERWRGDGDGFIRQVKRGALVPVAITHGDVRG